MPGLGTIRNASLVAAALAVAAGASAASAFSVLYDFNGTDAVYAQSPLVADSAGDLFGTSPYGGAPGQGSVFELPPQGGPGSLVILHAFTGGSDGSTPFGGLVADSAGDLFGVTSSGGDSGAGTIFELARSGSTFAFETLYAFSGGADGSAPVGTLVIDSGGTLYGTTARGGPGGTGTVFALSPGGSGFALTTLHAFSAASSAGVNADGAFPEGALLRDDLGTLFGTTAGGGASAAGVVFALVPGTSGYSFSVLHEFSGGADGTTPAAGLVEDRSGNLFGTTSGDSTIGLWGTVFELARQRGGYAFRTLHTFEDAVDGSDPLAGLVLDSAGDLLGTAATGGASNAGTIFELFPDGAGFTFRLLYQFSGDFDGAAPAGGVVFGPGGRLYGDTVGGGLFGWGAIFAYTPPPIAEPQIVRIPVPAPVMVTLSGFDPALPDAAFTFAIASPPAHGTLSPVAGGTVTYTPDSAFSGADAFTFTAADANGTSNPATVRITTEASARGRIVPVAPTPPAPIDRGP